MPDVSNVLSPMLYRVLVGGITVILTRVLPPPPSPQPVRDTAAENPIIAAKAINPNTLILFFIVNSLKRGYMKILHKIDSLS